MPVQAPVFGFGISPVGDPDGHVEFLIKRGAEISVAVACVLIGARLPAGAFNLKVYRKPAWLAVSGPLSNQQGTGRQSAAFQLSGVPPGEGEFLIVMEARFVTASGGIISAQGGTEQSRQSKPFSVQFTDGPVDPNDPNNPDPKNPNPNNNPTVRGLTWRQARFLAGLGAKVWRAAAADRRYEAAQNAVFLQRINVTTGVPSGARALVKGGTGTAGSEFLPEDYRGVDWIAEGPITAAQIATARAIKTTYP